MSAYEVYNIDKVKEQIDAFHWQMLHTGQLQRKREVQQQKWLHANFRRALVASMEKDADVQRALQEAAAKISSGAATPRGAAERISQCIRFVPSDDPSF